MASRRAPASAERAASQDSSRAMGEALMARADDCWRMCEEDLRRAGIAEVGTAEFRAHRRACQKLGIELMGRWLKTGEISTEEERAFLGRLGEMAAQTGVSINQMARGYLMYRDAVSRIIEEEADRLQSPDPVIRAAKRVDDASVEASIVWMTHAYDRAKEALDAALATSEARFRGVFESMATAVLLTDAAGVVVSCNEAAAEMLEIPAERLVGVDVCASNPSYTDASGAPLPRLPIPEVIETGQPVRGLVVKHDVGEGRRARWHQIDAVPIRDGEGRLIQVLTTFSDVTAVKTAEELRAESEAKNRFLATMSHELRTPLNSILGFAQLLASQGGKLDEKQKRYLANIETSGKHLLTLISDILELSRVASGQVVLSLEDCQLVTVIQDVAAEFEPMLANQPVMLHLDLQPWLRARVDPRRFQQVLVNLVANALKFTEKGSVTVSSREAGEVVEVRVADTGIGIPADQLERVFDEFTQVDSSPTRVHGGTGLGLPLARRLVEMMGGTLWLESEQGKGTTAIVRLPRLAG